MLSTKGRNNFVVENLRTKEGKLGERFVLCDLNLPCFRIGTIAVSRRLDTLSLVKLRSNCQLQRL